jgi:Tfp pilus assembly protein PilV
MRPRPVRFVVSAARGRGEGGFSQLEVVLGVVILTSVTLGTLLVVIPVSRQVRVSREMELANIEARRVLEQIQASPFAEITTLYPPGSTRALVTLPSGQLTVNYVDPAADPLFVQATLAWTSADLGPMSRTFTTVRTE